MEPEEFSEIDRFLLSTGKENLYEYLELSPESSLENRQAVIAAKRRWAQDRQSNPKYKQEAIWFIRNLALCQEALLTESAEYLQHIRQREDESKLRSLTEFIEGITSEGTVGLGGIQLIWEHGLRQGLSTTQIEDLLSARMQERGITKRIEQDPSFVDHYGRLDISPTATQAELERAYRVKYDDARRLNDAAESARTAQALDRAWDALGTESARTAFDALYDEHRRAARAPSGETHQTSFGSGPLHRAPGESETEIAPASTEGIGFAGSNDLQLHTKPATSTTTTTLDPASRDDTHSIRLSPVLRGPESFRQARIRHQERPKNTMKNKDANASKEQPAPRERAKWLLLLLMVAGLAAYLLGTP